jgi:pimeloyl-ACP methyl ester carboxylesterase
VYSPVVEVGALRSSDAIIIVPGILGSELIDSADDKIVWGLSPRALAGALITGTTYDRLQRSSVRPTGRLLRVPSYLPGLGRLEPYTALASVLTRFITHPAAIGEFAYDWRQSLTLTARELASFAHEHLARWREHRSGSSDARLVLVGHSMGGLLARQAAMCHLDAGDVAMILTLGTPFGGSVRAVRAIGHGDLLPLGALSGRLRALARRTPSLYDLLPTYPAVERLDVHRAPSTADFLACGARPDLLKLADDARAEQRRASETRSAVPLFALVGTTQPTLQSFSVRHGELEFFESIDGRNWGGDGTVYFGAAYPQSTVPFSLPQQHGALAKTNEAIEWIRHTIAAVTLGPPMGAGIGIVAPDAALVGESFEIRIEPHGIGGVTCRIDSASSGSSPGPLTLTRRDDDLIGAARVNEPDIYTITAQGGGFSAVQVDILVVPDDP